MTQRTDLVAPCGLDCGICELYVSRENEKLRETLIAKGIPEAVLPCDGCRAIEGRCPVIQGSCATFACAAEKNLSSCADCSEFPCTRLAPAADKAAVLPHNLKVFNLCFMKQHGTEAFLENSADIKKAYYTGNMVVGKGPQLEDAEEAAE